MDDFSLVRVFLLLGIIIFLAIFEIQIEGASGWAEKLPCWRAKPDSWMQKIYGVVMGGKPLDGFHISELVLLLLFFHLPFGWGVGWSGSEEMRVLSSFFVTAVCWDFLWFIFNPAYGWKKFKSEHIWWHKKWFLGLPVDYYGGVGLGLVLSFFGGLDNINWPLSYHFQEMLTVIFMTGLIAHIFSHPQKKPSN